MKYHCSKCNLHIWVKIPISQCPICKKTNIVLLSQLDFEGSDIDVVIKMNKNE
jgi:hypothetical protein